MKMYKFLCLPLFAFVLVTPSFAGTTINVKLSDNGGTMDMSKGMGLGIGMHGDMKTAIMGIEIDKKTVKTGVVTFAVKNSSKETVHELIVSAINNPDETLPYLNNENRVDEEHGSHLGEVSELEGGASGALTISLKPGMYALFCNLPNHYMDGMWTLLEVNK
ncbi:MAG: hypothetical protein ABIN69_18030 [Aestuariivirga sp.]